MIINLTNTIKLNIEETDENFILYAYFNSDNEIIHNIHLCYQSKIKENKINDLSLEENLILINQMIEDDYNNLGANGLIDFLKKQSEITRYELFIY